MHSFIASQNRWSVARTRKFLGNGVDYFFSILSVKTSSVFSEDYTIDTKRPKWVVIRCGVFVQHPGNRKVPQTRPNGLKRPQRLHWIKTTVVVILQRGCKRLSSKSANQLKFEIKTRFSLRTKDTERHWNWIPMQMGKKQTRDNSRCPRSDIYLKIVTVHFATLKEIFLLCQKVLTYSS